MEGRRLDVMAWGFVGATLMAGAMGCDTSDVAAAPRRPDPEGQRIFRHETFGDEQLWTDQLRMHEVVASSVSPETALSVGLKVDSERVPLEVLQQADLKSPATTVELIRRDAVVGLKGQVQNGRLVSLGITCALCHSTVDNSVMRGVGKRLDGWANRDLNAGLILSLSPAMQDPAKQAVLKSWGPGKYDAYWNHDGINDPQVIPPAYGLAGVSLETFTGEGPISYWNSYVAVTQMGGQGDFSDPRLGIHIDHNPDLVTPKLPVLRDYQLSLPAPTPPPGSFDAAAASRGATLFTGRARCVTCHSGATFTDANARLHSPAEVGQDPTLASRGTTKAYRTTPLRGAWQHPPYFHNGSARTLRDVVRHYDTQLGLALSEAEMADLEQYLKSL